MCSRRRSLFSAEWGRPSFVSSLLNRLAEKLSLREVDGREMVKAAPALATPAQAICALALGAWAVGALAVGALAIGRAQIRRFEIDELVVGKLRVTEEWSTPSRRPANKRSGGARRI